MNQVFGISPRRKELKGVIKPRHLPRLLARKMDPRGHPCPVAIARYDIRPIPF